MRYLLALLSLLSSVIAQEKIEITLSDPEPLPERLYSFNTNLLMPTALQGIGYSSPEFRKALDDLKPRGLRFPGGTTANNYLWEEDSFAEQADDKTKWAAQQLALFRKIGRPYDLPGFAAVCNELDIEPIWVLNVYNETPESIVALIEKWDELGLDVKAVELGNETYWDPRSLMNVWPYIEYCRPLAQKIRELRPDIEIGVCFGSVDENQTYAEKWNKPLLKQNWYDAIIYHEYYGGQGFAMEAGADLPVEALLRPEAMIDEPVEALAELIDGKPIWFTEWNIGSKGIKQWKDTGAELLYLGASMTAILEQREHYEWSCFHQFYQQGFGTFYYDKEEGLVTQPSYEFFRLVGAIWDGAESIRMLEAGESDDVIGFATERGAEIAMLVVNRGEAEAAVSLPDGFTGSVLSIDATPEKKLSLSSTLTEPLQIEKGVVTLPAFSISILGSPEVIEKATRREPSRSKNLFPPRPHLSLWYPPYARQQPRVASDGSYEVDFSKFADKKNAVVKMDLSGISPKAGSRYEVKFKGKAAPAIGFVVKLPESGSEGNWTQLLPKESGVFLDFIFDPRENNGEVSFLINREAIAKVGTLSLRDFSVVELSEEK